MYDQFYELAGVDITKAPMEVGPTCHYFMGGIRVDPETGETIVPGLFATGECSGGMNGANRLGGNSLSDLLVFGRRAGIGAVDYANEAGAPTLPEQKLLDAASEVHGYLTGAGSEDPYKLHRELQTVMGEGVGIFRDEDGLTNAIRRLEVLEARGAELRAPSPRPDYNPGWRLCGEVRNMITVSLQIARAALMREESRGGHSRLDHPRYDEYWSDHNIVISGAGGEMTLEAQPVVKWDGLTELVEARQEAERV
jgi:succinate dehydrogenase / fumarate reductase flavoprotein subunit